jgi:catechol 2,3-dioxygenase-like lactoylglutathione lyase family enzyme
MIGARLSHLFANVSSLEESRRFYVDRLGLEVLFEEPGYLRVGNADGWHMGMEEGAAGDGGIEIVLRVEDVDAAYAALRADGVEFDSAPQSMPWGMRHAWLKDPSGHRLSLYSP